jgi:putative transposase
VRANPKHELRSLLAPWPVNRPPNWARLVNQPQTQAEQAQVKLHITRNRPLGDPAWIKRIAKALKLEQSLRDPGRQTGWRKRKQTLAKGVDI